MKGKEPDVCFFCKQMPTVLNVSGCYYVQCTHCNKWDKWEFCGTTRASVIRQWNRANCDGRHFAGE